MSYYLKLVVDLYQQYGRVMKVTNDVLKKVIAQYQS